MMHLRSAAYVWLIGSNERTDRASIFYFYEKGEADEGPHAPANNGLDRLDASHAVLGTQHSVRPDSIPE